MVGHCRDTLRLGIPGVLSGWALQGYSAVRHCRDALPLSTAVTLRLEGEDNIDFENLTTPPARVGNKAYFAFASLNPKP